MMKTSSSSLTKNCFSTIFLVFIILFVSSITTKENSLIAGRWERIGHAHPSTSLKVQFSLVQPGKFKLPAIIEDVSNPKSSNYGNYLTHSQLAQVLATPIEKTIQLQEYLINNGAYQCELVQTRDMLQCSFSVEDIEKNFKLRMSLYECVFTGRRIIRTTQKLELSPEFRSFVELISGVSDFTPFSSTHQFSEHATYLQLKEDAEVELPFYITVRSRELGKIKFQFIPPCLTMGGSVSSPSTSDQEACPGNPITLIEIIATSAVDTISKTVEGIYPANCSTAVAKGRYYTCTAFIEVDEYIPWSLSYYLYYLDGTISPLYTYPYFSVSTPQLVVQSVQDYYQIPRGSFVTNINATQCVAEFEQQYYNTNDLIEYFEIMGLPDLSDNVILIGPNDESLPGTEASLDLQWIMGLAPGSMTTFWSNQANSSIEIDHILTWQYAIGNATNPPLVSSVSYAMTESTANFYLGDGYIQRSNTEFQKLASMGLTMIFSAGDAGANSFAPPPMDVLSCFPSHAMWPADSPYVTAVSATYFTPFAEPLCYRSSEDGGIDCSDNPLGEVAVSIDYGMFWTTGGGFSDVFAQPSYQASFVNQYLSSSNNLPESSYFNVSGRAYPDVSSVGHNLVIVDGGDIRVLDGTSASAPIFAAMITLLNNARMNEGKSALGFLNPFLYEIAKSSPASFNDVSVGHNACGGFGPPVCCQDGFYASPGWDPVTGLGTPNFPVFYEAALGF